jgi:hypothetical protein
MAHRPLFGRLLSLQSFQRIGPPKESKPEEQFAVRRSPYLGKFLGPYNTALTIEECPVGADGRVLLV